MKINDIEFIFSKQIQNNNQLHFYIKDKDYFKLCYDNSDSFENLLLLLDCFTFNGYMDDDIPVFIKLL